MHTSILRPNETESKKDVPSPHRNGAEAILEILRTNGTDCIFASPIAVMAPLWEALAARRERREPSRGAVKAPYVQSLRGLCAFALLLLSSPARADTIFVTQTGTQSIGEYTTSGTTVNASLISGLPAPGGLAVSGSDLFIGNTLSTVGEYTTSGATVNASLISGLNSVDYVAVSGSDLFVGSGANTIGKYTTSGGIVNASLISGLNNPAGIAISGADLFVANFDSGTIGEYTTSGGIVNASLISGLNAPVGIGISGTDLFVANFNSGTIGEYTTSGGIVNASLISGLNAPNFVAVDGSDLFVVSFGSGTIGEYTTSGATVNASLISGLSAPTVIVTAPVPEPSSFTLVVSVGAGMMLVSFVRLAKRHRLARCSLTRHA